MKLTEELKDKVDKTKTKEEAKQTIENAGMILDDAELDQVAGGFNGYEICERCGCYVINGRCNCPADDYREPWGKG